MLSKLSLWKIIDHFFKKKYTDIHLCAHNLVGKNAILEADLLNLKVFINK